jgi:two-component system, NtrC family, sensor kinase
MILRGWSTPMRRRDFITLLGGATVAWPIAATTQNYRRVLPLQKQILREQTAAAANRVHGIIRSIESQIEWITQLPWTADDLQQRRIDARRLLHQVPSITEFAHLDSAGRAQVSVQRGTKIIPLNAKCFDATPVPVQAEGGGLGVGMPIDANLWECLNTSDSSNAPSFSVAMAKGAYYGPVYFRREPEPYMIMSRRGTGRDAGVSVAEVNLKTLWDVVFQINDAVESHAYVVDAQGRLIAHPDISLVLRNTNMSNLPQVQAALGPDSGSSDQVGVAHDLLGHRVLAAHAPVAPLGWQVLMEQPAPAYPIW